MDAPTRRRFLKGGIAVGVLAAIGSAVAFVRTRGYSLPSGHAGLEELETWEFVVVRDAARRIAAPDKEGDASIPSPDDLDVAGFVDRYAARMPASLRRDLSRFFAYLEHVAPALLGFGARFTRLEPAEQDKVLAALEASDNDLLRGGFAGLKSLVFLGYYRDVRTWKMIGYEGPTVNRPAGGWTR
jgi:gluconate 2-dehydrogenase subunit 3-like protein